MEQDAVVNKQKCFKHKICTCSLVYNNFAHIKLVARKIIKVVANILAPGKKYLNNQSLTYSKKHPGVFTSAVAY